MNGNCYHLTYKKGLFVCHVSGGQFTYKKIAESTWAHTRASGYVGNGLVLTVYKDCCYQINVKTGKHKKLKANNWDATKGGVVYKGAMYAFGSWGCFRIDPNTGNDTKLTGHNCSDMIGGVARINNCAYWVGVGGVHELNLDTGKYRLVKKEGKTCWNKARAINAYNGKLYVCY